MSEDSALRWIAVGATCIAVGALLQTLGSLLERTGRAKRTESWFWSIGWAIVSTGAILTAIGSWAIA